MPESTQTLTTTKKEPSSIYIRDRDTRRAWQRMRAFLRVYEKYNGNVTKACTDSGVSRHAFYRWYNGDAPLHLRFQKQIARIQPIERRLDGAELVVDKEIADGNLIAAMFTLKSQGKHRGWSERELTNPVGSVLVTKEAFDQVVEAFRAWLDDYRDASDDVKVKWLCRFADNSGVDCGKLAERVGIQLPEGHGK